MGVGQDVEQRVLNHGSKIFVVPHTAARLMVFNTSVVKLETAYKRSFGGKGLTKVVWLDEADRFRVRANDSRRRGTRDSHVHDRCVLAGHT